ncbi:MAG: GTPase HflX, partial [Simkaniaceae bacterium]|nr:GTPase HflX [Simkaniaceae bacterium]
MGKGKLEELAKERKELDADVVIIDDEISPNQQKNIEKAFGIPVIDRSELILEVFSKHAKTREARLQIELAKHKYQLPRLRRMWTHLSRQSGSGQLKGEGEQQIEIDRRILRTRITQLEAELKNVRAHRMTQRRARLRSGDPLFAIIGYTNAGKSSLLNYLTDAGVLVEDKLFATLDTTTRKVELPSKQTALLIDTVGFVRKLPHTLVASFQSTLEEAAFTDVLIHVVDIADPMAIEHAETTIQVLKDLHIKGKPIITVLNKIDECENNNAIRKFRLTFPKTVMVSAKTGEGIDILLERMQKEIEAIRKICDVRIPQKEYALVSQLMREGRVLNEEYDGNDILLQVEVPEHLVSVIERYLV